jgi:NAD(P)-dependent dehydrogenase (short-subunit alcohol dehydrogenase family)
MHISMETGNKVVIVTGGSGLIGRAILQSLKDQKFTVYNLDIAKSNIPGITDLNCDVTDHKAVAAAFHDIYSNGRSIFGLVNNAYPRTADWGTPFEKENYSSIMKNIEMQLAAQVYVCQQVGEYMKTGGSIVNLSSIYGVVGNDPLMYEGTEVNPPAAYSAIKGGIVNFTRFLAARWGHRNIRVNCISPGGIFNHQDQEFVKRYEARVPMKRMGNPDDIAGPVGFLLSDSAKYITGHNLVVDGGWTCI